MADLDLSAGSTRKAWESWLIESGLPISRILASQGHDMNTSMKHYYNNDVTPEERIKMKEMTWDGVRLRLCEHELKVSNPFRFKCWLATKQRCVI